VDNFFNICQQETIRIISGNNCPSVEIDKEVIENGFLEKFPGSTLAIFLFLITHLNKNGCFVAENIGLISNHLPCNKKQVIEGLSQLQKNKIIMIASENNKAIKIYLNFEKLATPEKSFPDQQKADEFDYQKENDTDTDSQPKKTENIQLQALKEFLPVDREQKNIIKQYQKWLNDFDAEVIQELIRRIKKWCNSNSGKKKQAYYYMSAIVEDWYKKEIFSYTRLQLFDRLYRESNELAATYGIRDWKNVNPVQMETFQKWLTGDAALSLRVAKFAIQQAIKRKKDGQPSLKYIEDNFINPWKQASIKNINQAREFLDKNSFKKSKKKKEKKPVNQNWESFNWDMDQITQGGSS